VQFTYAVSESKVKFLNTGSGNNGTISSLPGNFNRIDDYGGYYEFTMDHSNDLGAQDSLGLFISNVGIEDINGNPIPPQSVDGELLISY